MMDDIKTDEVEVLNFDLLTLIRISVSHAQCKVWPLRGVIMDDSCLEKPL